MNEPTAIVNVLIIALTCVASYLAFRHPAIQGKALFSTTDILRNRQYYRMLSSGFIHADTGHLFFNMFSLYSFGSYIEFYFGSGFFLIIYLASMLGGNVVSLYLHRNHAYRALGASGGVCGIIFASIFLLPGGSVYLFFIPIPIPSWLFAVVFVIASSYGTRRQLGNIGHDAHLGGALIGLFTTTILRPDIVRQSPVLYFSIIAIMAVLILYFLWRPSKHPKPQCDRSAARLTDNDRKVMEQLRGKIATHGMESLTATEKQWLRDIA